MQRQTVARREDLVVSALAAFIRHGTMDLSLDELAKEVRTSKRMLVHYFGGRENLEERAMVLLEERLRAQFSPKAFPARVSAQRVLNALWSRTTAPGARGVLLLVMDLSRRAWSGSERARSFYEEQQRLWVDLLMKYLPDRSRVEEVLQLFQGAVLAYLITGDPEPGRRSLKRLLSSRRHPGRSRERQRKSR